MQLCAILRHFCIQIIFHFLISSVMKNWLKLVIPISMDTLTRFENCFLRFSQTITRTNERLCNGKIYTYISFCHSELTTTFFSPIQAPYRTPKSDSNPVFQTCTQNDSLLCNQICTVVRINTCKIYAIIWYLRTKPIHIFLCNLIFLFSLHVSTKHQAIIRFNIATRDRASFHVHEKNKNKTNG